MSVYPCTHPEALGPYIYILRTTSYRSYKTNNLNIQSTTTSKKIQVEPSIHPFYRFKILALMFTNKRNQFTFKFISFLQRKYSKVKNNKHILIKLLFVFHC